ncbi:protein NLRC5 isoform X1 [Cervus elaphus]|uniref:protein NLRC5 isoform X1 n=1 Tax=Cervus elaphus TaxID=9860 RepID=UPI001CC2C680|nr:protein NLRC5 isoform X1 [Cervus elaphus]XP_043754474.1 protein NLRC5 isoform X1 [Cervus elaphus]
MDPISLQLGTRNLHGCLVRLLSRDLEWLNAKVKLLLPNVDLGSGNQALDPTQRVILILQKLHTQGPTTWKSFIHCLCMEQDVPLDMEVPLMSTWGHEDGFPSFLEIGEESQSDSQLHPGLKRPHQSCGSSPRPKQLRKQQQELAERYLQLLRTSAQQRYGDRTPGPGQPLAFHQAYVPPILQWSRTSAPFHTQEGAVTGDPKAEDGTLVNIRDLFSTKASKGPRVRVLLGKAGMGKTTLAHRLCRKWADGELDRFQAVFLFEFRQLNLITGSLTLQQLLFDVYLRPEASPEAVFQHLKENADGILLIFDGLDEILQPCSDKETADPEDPASALTLFSRLCRGTLLPGCWVMAMSRPGKLPACLPTEVATVHMWGFDGPRVEEYVNHFFSDQPSQEAALAELRADRHLRSLCAVPALCRVACLCLHHLLPDRSPGQSAALLPTMTQNYVQMLLTLNPRGVLPAEPLLGLGEVALSGLESGKVIFSAGDIPASTLAFGAALGLLTSFGVCTGPGHQDMGYAFSHLSLQEFFAALHLMASPQVDREALSQYVTLHSRWVQRTKARLGLLDHLPTFLAGLASHACRAFLSLLAQQEEEWVAAKQAAVLQALRKLATRRLTGPKVVELCHCVGETQEPELARFMAHSLPQQLPFHNFLLTYADLASLTNILGHRDGPIHLDFEGCPLEPRCPETLAGCGQVENLSFKSRKCGDAFAEALSRSLPTMGSLKKLGLAGSKITARGISHLVQALPLCPQLEEVSFQDNQLKDREVLDIVKVLSHLPRLQKLDLSRNSVSVSTLLSLTKVAVTCPTIRMLQVRETDLIFLLSPPTETAAELQGDPDLQGNDNQRKEAQRRSLALRLQKCQLGVHDVEVLIAQLREGPQLDEVDLSGNQLKDEGCQLMAEAAPQLHIMKKLDLSDNGLSVAGVLGMLSVVSTCQALTELHISLLHKTVVFTFAPEQEEQEGIQKSASLSDLSQAPQPGNQEDPLKPRATFPDSLTFQMPSEPSLRSPRIRLTHCALQAQRLELLCKALGGSCCLGHLDLSGNALGDEGVALLARLLPGLGSLQSLNLSENGLSLEGVFSLTQCFSSLRWLLHLEFSSASQHVILRGDKRGRDLLAAESLPEFRAGARLGFGQRHIPRSFCLKECQLEPLSISHLCKSLEKCPGPLEVQLSCEVLSDQSLETLLHCLPQLAQLSLLQLSQAQLPPRSPLLLADLFNLCPQVQKVDLRSLRHLTLHFRSGEEQEDRCCCRFTDCGLRQEHVEPLCCLLSKCEDLNQLDLSANLLGDDGLRCLLERLPQVPISGSLDLSHNSMSQESILSLLEALPSCPRVREASMNLGSKQSFWIHFSQHEEAGKTLRLSECHFKPEHVPRLATSLSQALQLTELTLTCCFLGLEQLTILLGLLTWPTGLLTLRVEEPWVGRAGVLTLLEVCAQASGNITEISISETQQQLCIQLEFPHQENPEAVALRWDPVPGTPRKRLNGDGEGEEGLAHCDLGTHQNLLARQLMETCARLRQLSLSQVNLCDASSLLLQSLLLSLSELKNFRLTSSCVSSKGLAHLTSGLSHCHLLEELDLSNNQLGEEDTKMLLGALEGKCRLKRLDLSHLPLGGSTLAVLTQGLGHMTFLQSLRLSRSNIDDVGCCHLSKALRAATSLEELGLSHNQIGDTGAQELAAVLPGLPELRKIDLTANGIGPAGGARLADSLTLCRHLEELMLGFNALGDCTALGLANGLPRHLRVLHLPSSHLSPEGVLSLGQALDGCPHVEKISLAENSLTGGVPRFHQGLPLLRQLDLVSCEIDNQTAKPLAASFVLCPALEEITLSWNLLGDEAAAELARVLPQMGQLKRVDLEKNRITAYGASLLAEGLAQGSGIQVIRLWNNPIPPDMAQHLQNQEPRLDFAFFDNQPQVIPRGT